MNQSDNLPLMLTIARKYRDQLRKMAAQRNLDDPNAVTSAASIAAKIVINYLETEGEERV